MKKNNMNNIDSAIYLIESGLPLALVKQHLVDRRQVHDQTAAMALELGVSRIVTDRLNGKLRGVCLERGKPHPDFKKPNAKGVSYPRHNSAWAKRFAAQVGHADPSATIASALGIPVHLSYTTQNGTGSTCIGSMLTECGWLYLGVDGPYALWIPDVAAEVAAIEADGTSKVTSPGKTFDMHIEGCRRIEHEEWEILVAQHKLAEKRASLLAA